MSSESGKYDKYKQFWMEEASKDKKAQEERRKEALNVAKKLETILVKEFSAKKVVLYGSVLDKERFKDDSDIDLAVEGLPKEDFFPALGRLMRESPFEVDLKPIEDASDLLLERISRGKVLYEKGKNS